MQHSIHTFDPDLRYQRSFGPVPPVEGEWVLERWGAGGVSLAESGDIIFTQRLPHRVYRFTRQGVLLWTSDEVAESSFGPDDAFVREQDGILTKFKTANQPVMRPHPALDAGDGWLVVSRSLGTERHVDVIGPDGHVRQTFEMPPSWRSISQSDPGRGWLWVKGERDAEPVFFRITYRLQLPSGTSPRERR